MSDDGYRQMESTFAEAGLLCPSVPLDLRERVRMIGEWKFATEWSPDERLYTQELRLVPFIEQADRHPHFAAG